MPLMKVMTERSTCSRVDGGQSRPFAPAARQAALEQAQILAMQPGIDALQAPVGRHLAPEGDPEGALDVARLVHRQRLGEQRQQLRLLVRATWGQALLDAPQDQPQGCDDDVLLGVEVVRDHAGGVARLARDAHDRRLVEAVLRHDAAGDQGDLVAALLVVDDLGHGSLLRVA